MLAKRPVQIFSRFCGRSANTHLPNVLAETPDELDVPSPGARADRAGNRLFNLGAFVPADSDDLKIGGCRHSSSVAIQHILAWESLSDRDRPQVPQHKHERRYRQHDRDEEVNGLAETGHFSTARLS